MDCINPEHQDIGAPPEVCAGCYADLGVQYTALNDRYMILLRESQEWERKAREAARGSRVVALPREDDRGVAFEAGERGFESVHGTDALQVIPRTRQPSEDVVVIRIFQRTMGPSSGRGQLLTRAHAVALHAWLGWWIANGWPGVPRACGLLHRDDLGRTWQCDQPPEHVLGFEATSHEGPCIGWRNTDHAKPGRQTWRLSPGEYLAAHQLPGARVVCSPQRCLNGVACYAPACYGSADYGRADQEARQ